MNKKSKRNVKSCLALTLMLLITLLSFYGCDSGIEGLTTEKKKVGKYPVTVGEMEFTSQPQKIIVLSPSLADVVIALQCDSLLTAATVECTQRELEVLPKISATDKSAITSIDADLILTETLDDEGKSFLADVNTPVFEVKLANSRESFEKMYGQVATALMGDEYGYDTGLETARNIFMTLDTISRATSKDTITTACYLYDTKDKAVTGDSFGSLMLEFAGLTNVFVHDVDSKYDVGTLKTADPDIIFCDTGVKDEIMADANFSGLAAVKNSDVYELDKSYVEWLGKRVITGTTEIASLAFPELLEESNPEAADPTSKIDSAIEDEFSSKVATAESEKESSDKENSNDDRVYESLEYGDSGDDVYEIQERLSELGYLMTEEYDGEFGSYTESAIEDFQIAHGLNGTGIADVDTQKKLFSKDAMPKGSSGSDSSGDTSDESSKESGSESQ